MIRPEADYLVKDQRPTPRDAPDFLAVGHTPAENCARIKYLGYIESKHITMYGERLELVSDPVQEGDFIVVQVIDIAEKLNLEELNVQTCIAWIVDFLNLKGRQDLVLHASSGA